MLENSLFVVFKSCIGLKFDIGVCNIMFLKKNDCYLLLGFIVSIKFFICNLLRYLYICIIMYYNFKINIVMKSIFVFVLNFFNNLL